MPTTRTRGHHPSNSCLDTTKSGSIIAATPLFGWLFVGFSINDLGHHSHHMSVLGIPQRVGLRQIYTAAQVLLPTLELGFPS